jgi:hypothetical protein
MFHVPNGIASFSGSNQLRTTRPLREQELEHGTLGLLDYSAIFTQTFTAVTLHQDKSARPYILPVFNPY